ncbi:MAG: sodium-dependent transporter [Brevinema sp.]
MKRESWASSLGVILAVAGSAVGLGNFMRFPGLLARNGGGAFLIPYFVSLLVIGLPLSWLEWTIGRYGGAHGTGTPPGVFNIVFRKPWAKYLGSFSILAVCYILFYYLYLESIILGYAWFSVTGELTSMAVAGQTADFFGNYISFKVPFFGLPANVVFFVITVIANITVIAMGVTKGIERLAKILMPILLFLGLTLAVRVLFLPGMEQGLAFMWNPDFSKITSPAVWIDAAGQIFFTLSLGMGAIVTYSSYVKRDKDITLASLTANATNEFAEVILGGMIIIPTAAAVLGAAKLVEVAQSGTFGLSFITMPGMLAQLPFSQFFSIVWFLLLFFAGITSTLSLLQPMQAFFTEDIRMSKPAALTLSGLLFFGVGLYVVMDSSLAVLSEIDFWGGNLILLVAGLIEVILFATHIDSKKGWLELHRGGHITVPTFYRYILKFVTPVFLAVILLGWIIFNAPAQIMAESTPANVWVARGIMVAVAIIINLMIGYSWRRHNHDDRLNVQVEDSLHD